VYSEVHARTTSLKFEASSYSCNVTSQLIVNKWVYAQVHRQFEPRELGAKFGMTWTNRELAVAGSREGVSTQSVVNLVYAQSYVLARQV
jgi:hypothetical protein